VRLSWEAKRCLADGVTNAQIDSVIERALAAGATGAKVTGAGGGGFLLVVAPPDRQSSVRQAVSQLQEFPVKLDRSGSRVVFSHVDSL
jgi:D-glycero-alpha-D-manno-heptose-7-phosphate kinase